MTQRSKDNIDPDRAIVGLSNPLGERFEPGTPEAAAHPERVRPPTPWEQISACARNLGYQAHVEGMPPTADADEHRIVLRRATYYADKPSLSIVDREKFEADLAALNQYLVNEHACTNPDGSPKVDPAAQLGGVPDESGPAAALRLLKIARSRGAFLSTSPISKLYEMIEARDMTIEALSKECEALKVELGKARADRELASEPTPDVKLLQDQLLFARHANLAFTEVQAIPPDQFARYHKALTDSLENEYRLVGRNVVRGEESEALHQRMDKSAREQWSRILKALTESPLARYLPLRHTTAEFVEAALERWERWRGWAGDRLSPMTRDELERMNDEALMGAVTDKLRESRPTQAVTQTFVTNVVSASADAAELEPQQLRDQIHATGAGLDDLRKRSADWSEIAKLFEDRRLPFDATQGLPALVRSALTGRKVVAKYVEENLALARQLAEVKDSNEWARLRADSALLAPIRDLLHERYLRLVVRDKDAQPDLVDVVRGLINDAHVPTERVAYTDTSGGAVNVIAELQTSLADIRKTNKLLQVELRGVIRERDEWRKGIAAVLGCEPDMIEPTIRGKMKLAKDMASEGTQVTRRCDSYELHVASIGDLLGEGAYKINAVNPATIRRRGDSRDFIVIGCRGYEYDAPLGAGTIYLHPECTGGNFREGTVLKQKA